MKAMNRLNHNLLQKIVLVISLAITQFMMAQESEKLSLQKAIDVAMENNLGLKIKKLQKEEQTEKIEEAKIKRLPTVMLSSTYLYNFNPQELVIPKGYFGTLPLSPTPIPLPGEDMSLQASNHNSFSAGALLYQPITQQAKIKTGIDLSRYDVKINDAETRKAALEIQDGVQKLYYGLLINQKKIEEEDAKLKVEEIRLYDVESALKAGKAIDLNKVGVLATIADHKKDILKLKIEADNYKKDLKNLIKSPLQDFDLDEDTSYYDYISTRETNPAEHPEVEIAKLNYEKAKLGIKAAKQSNIPDVGVVGGYMYQAGNEILPNHNPYIGVNLKWNLQDLFTNKSVAKQRTFVAEQAQTNITLTEDKINNEVEKTQNEIEDSKNLIEVASKVVEYRKEELKFQNDRKAAGLNIPIDLYTAQANLAKAQADYYAAQLGYQLAVSQLKRLQGF